MKPRPLSYTTKEGGDWLPWNPRGSRGAFVHAVAFDDGSVFDAVNGWRTKTQEEPAEPKWEPLGDLEFVRVPGGRVYRSRGLFREAVCFAPGSW